MLEFVVHLRLWSILGFAVVYLMCFGLNYVCFCLMYMLCVLHVLFIQINEIVLLSLHSELSLITLSSLSIVSVLSLHAIFQMICNILKLHINACSD